MGNIKSPYSLLKMLRYSCLGTGFGTQTSEQNKMGSSKDLTYKASIFSRECAIRDGHVYDDCKSHVYTYLL